MTVTYTVSNLVREVTGSRHRHTATLTTAGTYVAGGFTVTPASLALFAIDNIFAVSSGGGVEYEWIPSTGKLKALQVAGGTPTGTVTGVNAQPDFTLAAGAALTADTVGVNSTGTTGRLVAVTAQTFSGTFSPVGAATFTGTFAGTATSAAALTEFSGTLTDTVFVEALSSKS